MRVLATVERFAPAIGGAERVVQRMAEGLAARGHEVHVLTGGTAGQTRLNGVTVHRLPVGGNAVRGIRGDGASVLRAVGDIDPDILFNYAAQTWSTDCCFELLERSERPRMVLAPCGFSGLQRRRYRTYFADLRRRLRLYDALVLHSTVYQDWRFAVDAGAQNLFVVANGADPPVEDAGPREELGGQALAVTVGSHVVSKGHAEFARTVRRLAREQPVHGAIVAQQRRGTDAVRGCQLTCWLRARGRHLTLIDGARPGAVARALAAADVFLFTSTVECAPLVILEAMAASTPWVSYDVGNVSELAGGIIVADSSELRTAAAEILSGRRPELGIAGHEAWRESHRWEDIVGRYESLFEQVMDSAPARPA